MYVSREDFVFWNIYRGIFGIESFWNRCFKVVSDFYQAV